MDYHYIIKPISIKPISMNNAITAFFRYLRLLLLLILATCFWRSQQ